MIAPLCQNKRVPVTMSEWVSEWVTRSPIELYWTAKHKQIKNSLKFKYWHFGGNRLLLLTKNALMKRCQKIWAGPCPPSFGQNPKEQQFFFRENIPKPLSMQGCVQISNWKDQSKELLLSMFPKLCFLHLVTGLQLGLHFWVGTKT